MIPRTSTRYPCVPAQRAMPTAWDRPDSPAAVEAAMTRPKRLGWLLLLRLPISGDLVGRWAAPPLIGVLPGDGSGVRLVSVRTPERRGAELVLLRDPLPSHMAVRVFRLDSPDPQSIAESMLRDWERGTLRTEPFNFDRLTT